MARSCDDFVEAAHPSGDCLSSHARIARTHFALTLAPGGPLRWRCIHHRRSARVNSGLVPFPHRAQ